ncbi:MAG: hypothetical protein IKO36_07240 [Bacteroidaceae bacterium]|nr:hypothetical protein [Bacteroidaceae bacterium]
MSELRALICQKCGASLNPRTLRCEYCGTYHERVGSDVGIMRVQIERPGVRVIRSKLEVDNYLIMSGRLSDEEVGAYIRKGLVGKLAESLPDVMETHSEYDPVYMKHSVVGQIRVLEPEYRF